MRADERMQSRVIVEGMCAPAALLQQMQRKRKACSATSNQQIKLANVDFTACQQSVDS